MAKTENKELKEQLTEEEEVVEETPAPTAEEQTEETEEEVEEETDVVEELAADSEEAADDVGEEEALDAEDASEDDEADEEIDDEAEAEDADADVVDDEALSAEMEQTKQELSVVREIREELAALYARNKELETEKEQLSSEVDSVKTELTETKEQLQRYIAAEERLAAKRRQERVEKLASKFKILGQKKTAEQLAAYDDETLSEYEQIVDAAVEKLNENKANPAVTAQSQAAENLSDKTEEASVSESTEKLSNKQTVKKDTFYESLCSVLSQTQNSGPINGKRVLNL